MCLVPLMLDHSEPESLSALQQMVQEQGRCVFATAYCSVAIDASSARIQDSDKLVFKSRDIHGQQIPVEVHMNGRTYTASRVRISYVSSPEEVYKLYMFDPDGQEGKLTAASLPLNWSLRHQFNSVRWRIQHWMQDSSSRK